MAAEVDDEPTWPRWTAAHERDSDPLGQFVLIQLDVAASVAQFQDDITAQAAAQISRRWYLAVAFAAGNAFVQSPTSGEYLLTFEFFLVGHGLPDNYPGAAIPLDATSKHPDGRPPIFPTYPLPWSNLYIYTLCNFDAMVSRVHSGAAPCKARIAQKDRVGVLRYSREDKTKWMIRKPLAPGSSAVVHRPPSPGSSDEGSDEDDGPDELPDSDSLNKALEDVQTKVRKAQQHVEMWLDLSTCSDPCLLATPNHILGPLLDIKQIWHDWENRQITELLAKRPHTQDWLNGVETGDEEESDKPLHGPAFDHLDDEAVLPADAVDDRAEEAYLARRAAQAPNGKPSASPASPLVPSNDEIDTIPASTQHTAVRTRKARILFVVVRSVRSSFGDLSKMVKGAISPRRR
ncbi:hypothetical protein EXIGLDRAFT_835155 [Exidia glandulosa HHB12029]|uniref:Uncharacterized protein n=1 Tax=Exidia glandulosa HHB12029 TaxID=1314781 RepID=A0A165J183_EXIGL|nr:hypothetical protein EXIGLDRAFT_835155 [Exidia glandulosa HHB12029]